MIFLLFLEWPFVILRVCMILLQGTFNWCFIDLLQTCTHTYNSSVKWKWINTVAQETLRTIRSAVCQNNKLNLYFFTRCNTVIKCGFACLYNLN